MERNFIVDTAATLISRIRLLLCGIPPAGEYRSFTLPNNLNPIILSNKKATLSILFAAVNQTLQAFAKNPQWRLEGRLGFISVLKTWSQTLIDHFHLHCLIPAGALSFTKHRWIPANDSYLFKITSVAKEFRKRYLKLLLNVL